MIFKTYNGKKKEEHEKLAGVMIPQQVYSYLSLYATANEISKSLILRERIIDWYRKIMKKYPISELISILSKQAQHEWDFRKRMNTARNFKDFLNEIGSERDLQNVDPSIIDSIRKNIVQ
jgi:hypothetical protein